MSELVVTEKGNFQHILRYVFFFYFFLFCLIIILVEACGFDQGWAYGLLL